ncbi:MAG: hypothetical protein U5R48_02345 [Gammaproteobacteria bacterium]|nr:hypothetical protein [Gammaproteobacteria bacterium]
MTTPADPTVSGRSVPYTYDTSAYENEAYTLEGRIQSNWTDKPFDFLAGVFYLESENSTIYDVRSNTLAALDPFGGTAAGPNGREAPLAWYRNDTDDYQLSTYAFFGEFYADITDRTRMTLGLRYSSETKEVADRQTLLNDPAWTYEENVSNRAFLQPATLASLIGDACHHRRHCRVPWWPQARCPAVPTIRASSASAPPATTLFRRTVSSRTSGTR